jgi:hypothetical protein
LTDDILSISLSGHRVEKFSIFISKLDNSLSKSLPPVLLLHSKEISYMILN